MKNQLYYRIRISAVILLMAGASLLATGDLKAQSTAPARPASSTETSRLPATPATGDPTGPLSLQQCVELAIANNLELKQAEIQAASAGIDYRQSRNNLLPSVNGMVEHGLNQGRSIDPFSNSYLNQNINYANYGLSGGVVLFNGLAAQHNIKSQRLAWEAGQADIRQNKDNLVIQVMVAYLQVLATSDQLTQIHNQAELSRKQVERLTLLNNEGSITPSQLFDLKGQLANDEISLINTKNQLESSRLSLCQLMNIPYDPSVQPANIGTEDFLKSYEGNAAEVYQTALETLAMVKSATLKKESAEQGVKAWKSTIWPTFSLNAGLFTNYSSAAKTARLLGSNEVQTSGYVKINGIQSPVFTIQDNFGQQNISYADQFRNNYSTNLNLSVRIPILNGLQTRNRINRSRLVLQNADVVEKTTRTRLQQQVEQAWLNMTATYNRYHTLLQQVDAFTESYRGTEARFNEGVLNSVDYLTAKNNLDRANISLIMAKYEYVLRTRILDYYQGRPIW